MKGEWLLIRLKPRGKERNTNWLLRKIDDEYAGGSDDLVENDVTSVKTGRSMAEIAKGVKAKELASWKKLRANSSPGRGGGPLRSNGGGVAPPAMTYVPAPSTAASRRSPSPQAGRILSAERLLNSAE
jgi:bifunctional non-homologous end joining protein LigD